MFFNKRNLSNFEAEVFIISFLVLVYDLMNTPILCSKNIVPATAR